MKRRLRCDVYPRLLEEVGGIHPVDVSQSRDERFVESVLRTEGFGLLLTREFAGCGGFEVAGIGPSIPPPLSVEEAVGTGSDAEIGCAVPVGAVVPAAPPGPGEVGDFVVFAPRLVRPLAQSGIFFEDPVVRGRGEGAGGQLVAVQGLGFGRQDVAAEVVDRPPTGTP